MPTNDNRPAADQRDESFRGFEHLTANFLYCPNQFFDVCLSHLSRGAVRLVAYMLRRTLGWLDEHGNPVEQNIAVTYRELIEAGISRGAIRQVIDEAVAARFLSCTQAGRPDSAGQSAQRGCYVLRWDTGDNYAKSPEAFQGFFAGEGHRSPIPNAFFDEVVPNETLAVVRVVGSVLRHTVGYETQFGRRSQAPLSYSYLQRYTGIQDRSTLAQAIQYAMEVGYIERVHEGHFDARSPQAATYAVKWRPEATGPITSSKTQPVPVRVCSWYLGGNLCWCRMR